MSRICCFWSLLNMLPHNSKNNIMVLFSHWVLNGMTVQWITCYNCKHFGFGHLGLIPEEVFFLLVYFSKSSEINMMTLAASVNLYYWKLTQSKVGDCMPLLLNLIICSSNTMLLLIILFHTWLFQINYNTNPLHLRERKIFCHMVSQVKWNLEPVGKTKRVIRSLRYWSPENDNFS